MRFKRNSTRLKNREVSIEKRTLESEPTCAPLARWTPRERDAATNVATKRVGHVLPRQTDGGFYVRNPPTDVVRRRYSACVPNPKL